jgi:hypothetical protein
MKKAILVFLLVVVGILPATAEPGWGGGILAGCQAISYPFFESFEGWNSDHRLAFYGGYGYGVTEKGFIGGGSGGLIDHAGKRIPAAPQAASSSENVALHSPSAYLRSPGPDSAPCRRFGVKRNWLLTAKPVSSA